MAGMAGLTVYNFPPQPPNWDAVGKFYISFCVVWSTLLFAGIAFLVANRHNPIVRVRGLVLPVAAILCLHSYWVLAQLVYPIGLTMPLVLAYDIQYFFMGIWFPLGIALFHAFNTRFLHVAEMQKRFLQVGHRQRSSAVKKGGGLFLFKQLMDKDFVNRILLYIATGMVVQVLLTVGMWLACRKYHPTFGLPGTELKGETLPEQLIHLGRGWEWWPSVLWQFVWTWIVAPMLIWRAWGIHDTLGWRFQTIGCCLSNLHATPMFLISTYVPAFALVNKFYAPSQWIHLSVLMFEIFTIFVPCWRIWRQAVMKTRAEEWNSKRGSAAGTTELSRDSSSTSSLKSGHHSRRGDSGCESPTWGLHHLTMSSLEKALAESPSELQDFSASRDFSAENVAYLRAVAAWKASWPDYDPSHDKLYALYNAALDIYTELVSEKDAQFPVNLCAAEGKLLNFMFEHAARIIYGDVIADSILPFTTVPSISAEIELRRFSGRVGYWGEIPLGFDRAVFDSSFAEIKYLVFTNTWPRYVLEREKSRSSSSSGSSEIP
ncbi:GPCR, GprK-type [Microdochium bolleyi]|uniref:GPCR, GprK-type n=1 Tax=Microdochium bolleyi TaxID=196109 RepID=A0A136ITV0_9PEZI|nr:GPCR, GprK-type [Microdochium bolleyi]